MPAIELAIALELDLICAFLVVSTLESGIDLALKLTLDLACNLSIQLGIDYGLYYAWTYARLFAVEELPCNESEVQRRMVTHGKLLDEVSKLARQVNQSSLLANLHAPAITASPQDWQQCADQLYAILQVRDLVHKWRITARQSDQLNAYFYANKLLVQCLNVAVVSDRQAILAGLLAPPRLEDEETRA